MNHLVYTIWPGAQHGGCQGPVAFQAPMYASTTPGAGTVIQLQTLQACGNGGQAMP